MVIVEASRVNEGVVIVFANGRAAFYSTALLIEMLNIAELIPEPND